MKIMLGTISAVLLAITLWMWSEVRATSDTFNSWSVSQRESNLVDASRIEAMLLANDSEAAIDFVRERRDLYVVSMSTQKEAIAKSSWRWPNQDGHVKAIDIALAREHQSRQTIPIMKTGLSEQAEQVLSGYADRT